MTYQGSFLLQQYLSSIWLAMMDLFCTGKYSFFPFYLIIIQVVNFVIWKHCFIQCTLYTEHWVRCRHNKWFIWIEYWNCCRLLFETGGWWHWYFRGTIISIQNCITKSIKPCVLRILYTMTGYWTWVKYIPIRN